VVFHEAFDGGKAGMAGVAETLGDVALDVEMEPLFRPAGEEMHVAAHGPEEVVGLAEGQEFLAREDTLVDQIFAVADPVVIFGDPEERMEVAKPALAVLDVGLDEIARFAGLVM